MDPSALSDFNARKAESLLALAPITAVFDHAPQLPVSASFGEVRAEPTAGGYGQSLSVERSGALYFPLFAPIAGLSNPPEFPPRIGHAFTITASPHATLVGTRWQCGPLATAAHEPVLKFTCHRLTG